MTHPGITGRADEDYEKTLLIERLLAAWKDLPYMRLGQLIVNAEHGDPFYTEDYDLIDKVEAFRDGLHQ